VKDRNVGGERNKAGDDYIPLPVDRGEDWLWMVAADPAFYLEEIEGARPRGK
jgi:hypothetical protein